MILAFETSTRQATLAVYDRQRGELVREIAFTTDRAHNAVVFGPVETLLDEWKDELEGIVVGLGPGSYGGVRVGLSVANGLSIALGLPVAGVSSLVAWDSPVDSYLVVGDAKRGSFFVAEIRDRRLIGEPDLVDAAVFPEHRASLDPKLSILTPDAKVAETVSGAILSYPLASSLAARTSLEVFSFGDEGAPLEPHYLRAPYITTPKEG